MAVDNFSTAVGGLKIETHRRLYGLAVYEVVAEYIFVNAFICLLFVISILFGDLTTKRAPVNDILSRRLPPCLDDLRDHI